MNKDDARVAHEMAGTLLSSVIDGEKVDKELLDYAENIIEVYQLYAQLLFVGMVVDRIGKLPYYFDALDAITYDLDVEDLAEADAAVKLRAVSAFNQAIKTKVEVIGTMMASKDGTGILRAGLRDTFGENSDLLDRTGTDKTILDKLGEFTPEQRQRVLGGVINTLRASMVEDENDE
jgi:hypothetical protein